MRVAKKNEQFTKIRRTSCFQVMNTINIFFIIIKLNMCIQLGYEKLSTIEGTRLSVSQELVLKVIFVILVGT